MCRERNAVVAKRRSYAEQPRPTGTRLVGCSRVSDLSVPSLQEHVASGDCDLGFIRNDRVDMPSPRWRGIHENNWDIDRHRRTNHALVVHPGQDQTIDALRQEPLNRILLLHRIPVALSDKHEDVCF